MDATNAAQVNSSKIVTTTTQLGANSALTETDLQGLAGLTDAQWQTLVNLMNSQKTRPDTRLSAKNNEILWILDT